MRRLFTALPFTLLTLFAPFSQADEHEHGSLGTHEHGVARLNAALDGSLLALELQSPAMNLVGFEHPASTPAEQATVDQVRTLLQHPLALITLDAAAGCHVTELTVESPLFGDAMAADKDDDGDDPAHSEIYAHYQLTCSNPGALERMSLAPLFKTFPATRLVQVQWVAPNGQQGLDASAANNTLKF